jgi:mRNA interferase MazF
MIKQNEIWMVKLGTENIIGHEQKGNRPFYVISNDVYNHFSQTPIGYFLSTSEHKRLNKYTVETSGDTKGSVNVSQIRTLSADRFMYKIGTGTNEELYKMIDLFYEKILSSSNWEE